MNSIVSAGRLALGLSFLFSSRRSQRREGSIPRDAIPTSNSLENTKHFKAIKMWYKEHSIHAMCIFTSVKLIAGDLNTFNSPHKRQIPLLFVQKENKCRTHFVCVSLWCSMTIHIRLTWHSPVLSSFHACNPFHSLYPLHWAYDLKFMLLSSPSVSSMFDMLFQTSFER